MDTTSSPVELAKTQQNVFIATAIWAVFAVLVSTGLGIWLYRASNAYQEALKLDAEAKINEAKEVAVAADRRAENVEIQQKGRTLSADQKAALTTHLTNNPKGDIEIQCPIGAPEACAFAREFESILRDTGWNVTWNDRVIITPTPMGLKMKLHVDPKHAGMSTEIQIKPTPEVFSLIDAFERAEVPVPREGDWRVPEGKILLIVGFK